MKIEACPRCNCNPVLCYMGDLKQYLVYVCPQCHETPVLLNQARYTKFGARQIWNKRCKEISGYSKNSEVVEYDW